MHANIFFTQLLYSPSDFEVSLQRLCSRVKDLNGEGGEHMCFLGSGREQEDQNMNLVVAKFLHKSIPHISLARGGFLGRECVCVCGVCVCGMCVCVVCVVCVWLCVVCVCGMCVCVWLMVTLLYLRAEEHSWCTHSRVS